MNFAVIDTETTGMDDEDKIVEIAAIHSDGRSLSTLVNPEDRKISFGAMATHHITPKMVESAPTIWDALYEVDLLPRVVDQELTQELTPPVSFLVMHNASFDRKFLPPSLRDIPYVCTWRCALHLVPNAESHSNGALWYELGLDHHIPEEIGSHPHRALFDAVMTTDIFHYFCEVIDNDNTFLCLEEDARPATPEKVFKYLIDLSQKPVLLTKCRFGQHRDSAWADVPSKYMEWILTEDFDMDTKHTCEHWLIQRGRRQKQ